MRPGEICNFCGFGIKEGDAHQVWIDPMPNSLDLPRWGCLIEMDCIQPRPLGIITSEELNER